MFTNASLSFEAAPPIQVVLRYFLSATIFGVVLALFFLFEGNRVFSDLVSQLIATHIFTIGIMASFMFGALFQMLPVVCGVSVNKPTKLAMRLHYAFIVGLFLLLFGFKSGANVAYLGAGVLLGGAFFIMSFVFLYKLGQIHFNNASRGIFFALLSIAIAIFFALLMLLQRAQIIDANFYLSFKTIHLSFALFGWIFLLISSVSFQVIEMFYVTPPFKTLYAKTLPIALFFLLLLGIFAQFFSFAFTFLYIAIALIIAIHSLYSFYLLQKKKRAASDATIWLWKLGLMNGILFALLFIASFFTSVSHLLLALFFSFFALSIVFAMMFKIVPFLVWFHLNKEGYLNAPMMHEVIHPKAIRFHFYLVLITQALFLLSNLFHPLFYLSSFLLFILFVKSFYHVYHAWHLYLDVLKNGAKFDFNFS